MCLRFCEFFIKDRTIGEIVASRCKHLLLFAKGFVRLCFDKKYENWGTFAQGFVSFCFNRTVGEIPILAQGNFCSTAPALSRLGRLP